jgi:PAS domain S-box-containing protein
VAGRHSLKGILTLAFLLSATLPLVGFGAIALSVVARTVETGITARNQVLARSLAGEVDRFLDEPANLLRQIHDVVGGHRLVKSAEIDAYLGTVLKSYPFFNMIQILDNDGIVRHLAPYHRDYVAIEMAGQTFFRETRRTGRPYWSATFRSIRTGQPTLSLTRPTGEGMIVGYLDLSALHAIIERARFGTGGYAAITDEEGTVIAHKRPEFVAQRLNVSHLPIFKEGAAGREGTYRYTFDGQAKLGSVARVSRTGWVVAVIQPVAEAFAPVRKVRRAIWTGAVAAAALACMAALFIIHKTLTPLAELARYTEGVAGGEPLPPPEGGTYREVRQLAAHFNRLIDAVRAREASLKESEATARAILDATDDVAILLEPDGIVVTSNDTAARRLGLDRAALAGQCLFSLTAPDLAEERRRAMARVIRTGRATRLTTGYDGRRYNTTLYPVFGPDGGEVNRLVLYEHDTTALLRAEAEKAELEKRLERSRKMEAIGLLAGGVAHDLNNILSGIVTYPELMLLNLPGDSPLRPSLRTIQSAGERASAVVSDLLTVARGVASPQTVVPVNDIVREYLASPEHARLAGSADGVTVTTDLAADLKPIKCSPIHVKKALMNLIINASEAIVGEGTITVTTRNRRLAAPSGSAREGRPDPAGPTDPAGPIPPGDYALLSVTDTGPGIAAEDLDRIFEPFYTRKVMGRSGTGLGLTVVWNTVQDHGGYIDIRTGEGGTAFDLLFPVTAEGEADPAPASAATTYAGAGERILVVDDEQAQREIARELLNRLGYAVAVADSGEAALERLRQAPVDLLVLDMIMEPGMNGLTTYEAALRIQPDLRAVIASGYAETDDVRAARRLGAGAFIRKPYSLSDIGRAVRATLDEEQDAPTSPAAPSGD